MDHPADEWSDLDIFVIAADPKPYWSSSDWLAHIGTPWLTFVEPTADGRSMERRVLFEGGLDVDFAFFPLDLIRRMGQQGVPADAGDVFRRGMRVLVDKDGLETLLRAAASASQPAPQPPAQGEFHAVVSDFWYHAVWTAKHLRRGELWWAKSGCDDRLKYLLRRMLEWHARATKGLAYDTWLRGRFLEEWADPRALAELPQAFGHYDATDVQRALWATMHLFRWLAVETAERFSYSYPTLGDERATELVRQILASSNGIDNAVLLNQ